MKFKMSPIAHAGCTAIAVLIFVLCPRISLAAAGDTLHVSGIDGKSTDWTQANLKTTFASDIHPVQYTSKDGKHTSNCIPLMALLKSQAVPTEFKMDPSADPKKKNFNLRLAVVLQGADGYTITLSLGELMPDLGNKEAWIALDEDDKPLAERGGGLKMLLPGEGMPARNVHSLVNIAVVDPSQLVTPTPATQPTAQ